MKDAKGHGSDARGMASATTAGNHQAGILRLGRPGSFKVQQFNPNLLGQPWQTVNRVKTSVIAENVARGMRADNRNPAMVKSRVAGINSGERPR